MYLVYSIEHANRPFCICHLMVKLDENTVYNSCQINFECWYSDLEGSLCKLISLKRLERQE